MNHKCRPEFSPQALVLYKHFLPDFFGLAYSFNDWVETIVPFQLWMDLFECHLVCRVTQQNTCAACCTAQSSWCPTPLCLFNQPLPPCHRQGHGGAVALQEEPQQLNSTCLWCKTIGFNSELASSRWERTVAAVCEQGEQSAFGEQVDHITMW